MKKLLLLLAFAGYAYSRDAQENNTQLSSSARLLSGAKAAGLIPVGLLLTLSGVYHGVMAICDQGPRDFSMSLRNLSGDLLACLLVLHGPAALGSFACAGLSFVFAFKNIRQAVSGMATRSNCDQEKTHIP